MKDTPNPRVNPIAVQVLSDVKQVIDAWEPHRIPSSDLARLRNQLGSRISFNKTLSTNALSVYLRQLGLVPERSPFRMGGVHTPPQRGYTVRGADGGYADDWREAFVKYGLTSAASGNVS